MRTRVLRVLQNPNDLYGGMALWDATVADFTITGNAFWRKLRNDIGAVGGLEWLPSTVVTPRSDTTGVPLEYCEVQTARGPVRVPPSEMVHFRKGIDPSNPALGISPLRSLLREIETDEVAAAMTTALMRNFGVPGIVVIPETGEITPDVAEKAARDFQEQHSGENVGRPLFLRRKATVQVIGHSPRDLRLDELRGVPEERISATMGVNAAVLGLGRGLAAQKVGATLREYIQQAIKGTLSPMWDVMAEAITRQLLPDFGLNERWRLTFDRKRVAVLREEAREHQTSVVSLVHAGMLTRHQGLRMMGLEVDGSQPDVYILATNIEVVSLEDFGKAPDPPPAPVMIPPAPPGDPPPEEGQDDDDAAAAA